MDSRGALPCDAGPALVVSKAESGSEVGMTVESMWSWRGRTRLPFLATATAMILISVLIGPGLRLVQEAYCGQQRGRSPLRFNDPSDSLAAIPSEEGLARGELLVASRNLRDPNFSESVILLIDYRFQGAMGLIINRPTDVKLSTVLPEIAELKGRTDTVFFGGPVAVTRMSMLVRSASPPEAARQLFQDVYVSASLAVLRRMIIRPAAGESFRVFAGYAGWGPGQLDREFARGDWYVLPADAETLFDRPPAEIWPELIRRGSAQWVKGLKKSGRAHRFL